MTGPRDTGFVQSVQDRLRNEAEASERPFAEVLELYAVERFLHRLGRSPHRDRLVVKGAQLLRHWIDTDSRPTRDIDLYGASSLDADLLRDHLVEILSFDVEADAIDFRVETLDIRPIRDESLVVGLRAKLDAFLGRVHIRFQIDVGLGDSLFPQPRTLRIDGLLGLPVADVRAYTPYSAVAEKLEAIVVLGLANSRMKDYYDLTILPARLEFEGSVLIESVRKTFARRQTPIPVDPPEGLTSAFARSDERAIRWRAFLQKSRLTSVSRDLEVIVGQASRFLLPVLQAASGQESRAGLGSWPPGGPWEGIEA